jgi:hypothetical protein
MPMVLHVECYAGYKADERPQRFQSRQKSSRRFDVVEVLDQWYGVGYHCFKVHADDGNVYILRHSEKDDEWSLDSFRRSSS